MRTKTWMSGALLLHLAAWTLMPVGTARAAELHDLLRLVTDQASHSASAPDSFGRSAISANFFTKAMGEPRHVRGKGGKHRR